ncbi:polysaccharide deacetylase family protein [Thioalkalivibrio halophilus]|uniref:NodB homology domain-containing protein n=1 Tax=Thioalkalivibrio halophilus TaxID=252474 RepID=A0A1V2ZX17_9GAMM|nr:polysaccharide deacetylase family protein [Thioalkalivibrio halophilus]OOC09616.1 hypothetical protein B1A74_10130 [Thioalkalivibrio halophilus]
MAKYAEAPPALVVSLDFELHWGVSERVTGADHPYAAHLRGARDVIPRLLERFRERGIHATWATVGALFADGRTDLGSFMPAVRPEYERTAVDNYRLGLGASEAEDPLHFAPTLVKKIRETKGQELASHTFSHYFCDEPGQSRKAFSADLAAAQAIAEREGEALRSLVFPRNQVVDEYLSALTENGIEIYRGNPPGGLYEPVHHPARRAAMRAARLTDGFLNLTGHHTFGWDRITAEYPWNVQASRFLRPYSRKLRYLEPLRRRRVKAGIRAAAKRNEVFHLWWHPHNFGANQEKNLEALDDILDTFERLRESEGMRSFSMSEAADFARTLKR